MSANVKRAISSKTAKHTSVSQVLTGIVIGAVLGVGGSVFVMGNKIAVLETQMASLSKQAESKPANTNDAQATAADKNKADPELLIEIIKEKQRKYIKLSFGERKGQNFSDEDLKNFRASNRPATIAGDLKHDNRFLAVVLKIKEMDPTDRQALLIRCAQTYHPTWSELGKISPEGQSEAGQIAEREVAIATVSLVKDLLKLPVDEIKKLYT